MLWKGQRERNKKKKRIQADWFNQCKSGRSRALKEVWMGSWERTSGGKFETMVRLCI